MKRAILASLMLLVVAKAFAADGPGTTNANFLKAGQGVRPIAMGETYIALGDGLDTLYWNPAGLAQMSSPAASFIHSFWLQDIGTEYLAYGLPLGDLGAFGGGVTYMHAGTIDKTVEDQFGNYNGTDGQASANSVALLGAYSQRLNRLLPTKDPFLSKILVGAALRIVSESIADVSVFGGGIDIGAIWKETEEISPTQIATAKGVNEVEEGKTLVRDNGWRFGLVAQNLGMTSDQLMPINFRAGAGYVLQNLFSPNGRGTFALDAMVPIDNSVKVSFGTEYANISPNTEFDIRLGYKIGNEIQDLDSTAGFTAGLGFAIAAGLIKYQIDYAFVPYGDLGTTHRASLTLSFLPSENVIAAKPELKSVVSAPKEEALPVEMAPKAKAAADKKQAEAKNQEAKTAMAKAQVANPVAAAVPVPVSLATAASAGGAADEKTQKLKKLSQDLRLLLKQISSGMQPALVFENDTANIETQAKQSVDKLGKILERNSEGNVTIVGYAGQQADLAQARAKAVVRYLKMSSSMDAARLSTKAGDPAQQPKNSAISFEVEGQ